MMQTCTQTGGTYGTDVCTDACGGYYSDDDSIDGFVYRYYTLGDYNDGTSCDLPGCASPSSDYYPNTPVCFRGCCPSGVSCHRSIASCPSSGTSNGYTSSYSASVPTINGMSLASGLPRNTGGCSCDNLSCNVPCTSNGWQRSTCGAGSGWSNSCAAPAPTPAPTAAGGPMTCRSMAVVLHALVLLCAMGVA